MKCTRRYLHGKRKNEQELEKCKWLCKIFHNHFLVGWCTVSLHVCTFEQSSWVTIYFASLWISKICVACMHPKTGNYMNIELFPSLCPKTKRNYEFNKNGKERISEEKFKWNDEILMDGAHTYAQQKIYSIVGCFEARIYWFDWCVLDSNKCAIWITKGEINSKEKTNDSQTIKSILKSNR